VPQTRMRSRKIATARLSRRAPACVYPAIRDGLRASAPPRQLTSLHGMPKAGLPCRTGDCRWSHARPRSVARPAATDRSSQHRRHRRAHRSRTRPDGVRSFPPPTGWRTGATICADPRGTCHPTFRKPDADQRKGVRQQATRCKIVERGIVNMAASGARPPSCAHVLSRRT
jgi:hypothetical protein